MNKYDVPNMQRQFERYLEAQREANVGDRNELLFINGTSKIQVPAMEFILTELNDGHGVAKVGSVVAKVIGDTVLQLLALIPEEQREFASDEMLEMIKGSVKTGIPMLAKAEEAAKVDPTDLPEGIHLVVHSSVN